MNFKNWLEQRSRNDVYEYEAEEIPISKDIWAHAVFAVEFMATPPTPDVPYLPNDDPGYPGDPGGVEIQNINLKNVTVFDNTGNETKPPKGHQKWLNDWAWSQQHDIEQEILDNMAENR